MTLGYVPCIGFSSLQSLKSCKNSLQQVCHSGELWPNALFSRNPCSYVNKVQCRKLNFKLCGFNSLGRIITQSHRVKKIRHEVEAVADIYCDICFFRQYFHWKSSTEPSTEFHSVHTKNIQYHKVIPHRQSKSRKNVIFVPLFSHGCCHQQWFHTNVTQNVVSTKYCITCFA